MRSRVAVVLAVAVAVVVVSACGRKDVERVVKKDEGTLCLGLFAADAGGNDFVADLLANEPIGVRVRSPCLNDRCATDRAKICTAKRSGTTIVVSSELSWLGPREIDNLCAGPCSSIDAHCTIEALPAGKYTLVYGAKKMDIEIPSRVPFPCGGVSGGGGPAPVAKAVPTIAPVTSAPVATATGMPLPTATVADPAAPATGVTPETKPPGDAVCITPFGGKTLKAGQAATIRVSRPNPCLGNACAGAKPKCTAKRRGKTVVVVADFPAPGQKPRQPCTDDCAPLVATCKTDALAAGSYTFDFGARKETVTVPSGTPLPCDP